MDAVGKQHGYEKSDDQLFEQSWRAVYPELRRKSLRQTRGNLDRAQECLAATALKALLFFRRSPQRIRDPQRFLFLVLDHVFFDSLRHKRREEQILDLSVELELVNPDDAAISSSSPFEQLELCERLEHLHRHLAYLPFLQQRLFQLKFVDDMPYPQIARELGITEPLARKRVQLLRAALK
ncbi:RNA polymerase sigma factor [Pseudomonas oryzihabitans]|uniref:RNA polymerase sigma factor n=1 Tax=Pseudomonas oryzihabitans TaxID=47885 RepID=UPI002860D34A|nr:sigma-70 family RNA polymerase sigma factor [Pseudomonas psychrotolerans]MDR6679606.1 RNA polymerase sigma-70 factor (ECF subfamily) [Pseudomonas psychrotolerans]